MKAVIEIIEITLNSPEVYNLNFDVYKDGIIHLVTDEAGNRFYVLPNSITNMVSHIGTMPELNRTFANIAPELDELEVPDPIEGVVTESFALKAIAIASRGEMVNFKDIK